jgi:hypothetical protein
MILILLTVSPLSSLLCPSVVLGSESGTKFGLSSFTIAGVERSDLSYIVTLKYDASRAGNPWQGGIYGYGEIERLERWKVIAYFFQDGTRAGELASAGWTGFGFIGNVIDEAPDRITMEASRVEVGGRFNGTEALTGTIEARVDFRRPVIDSIRQGETFHVVFLAQISYSAFSGRWGNVAVSGPAQAGGEDERITVRVDGPAGISRSTTEATFTATTGGREADKISSFGWNFQYRREDGSWGGLDYISTGRPGLTVNSTQGQPSLDRWRDRADSLGAETPQGKQMAIRAIVSVYIGSTKITTSDPHSLVVSLSERTLTVTGPGEITAETDRAVFSAMGAFEADRVDWSFSYSDRDGNWVPLDTARTTSLGDLTINRTIGRINLDRWIQIARALSLGEQGPRSLRVRVSARAYKDGEPLAESEPHDFIVSIAGTSFDIQGPGRITEDMDEAEFRINNLADDDGEIDTVEWSFEYRNRSGQWIETGSTEREAKEALRVPGDGEPINLEFWRSVARIHGERSDGRITLRMNLTAQARSSNRQFLASAWHGFTVELESENRYRMMGLADVEFCDAGNRGEARELQFPMKNVKLVFKHGKTEEQVTTDSEGYYRIPDGFWDLEDEYTLEVHLAYLEGSVEYFTINGDIDHVIRLQLSVENDRIVSAKLVGSPGFEGKIEGESDLGPVLYLDRFDARGRNIYGMYIHMTEALEFYRDQLGVDLDFQLPVTVLPEVSSPTRYAWTEDGRSLILINQKHSRHSSPNRPKAREYHEFSHYAMHSMYGEMPESPAGPIEDINHAGYINPTTADSWAEGFAHFMALIIGEHYGNWWNFDTDSPAMLGPSALLYNPWTFLSSGEIAMRNLELDYRVWDCKGYLEEFAVTGVLWDLYDGPKQHAMTGAIRAKAEEERYAIYDIDRDGVLNGTEIMIMNLDDYIQMDYRLYDRDGKSEFNRERYEDFVKYKGKGDADAAISEHLDWLDLGSFLARYLLIMLDDDQDGVLTETEASGLFEEGLSRSEIEARFRKYDRNGDGLMGVMEVYGQYTGLTDDLLSYDEGHDGVMDYDEFRAMAAAKGLDEGEAESAFRDMAEGSRPYDRIGIVDIQVFLLRLEGTAEVRGLEITISDMARARISADDDDISLSFDEIWRIIREEHNDFHSVYRAFVEAYPSMREQIDYIFGAHGFFADRTEGNGKYDDDEPFRDENENGEYDEGEHYVDFPLTFDYDENEEIGRAANYGRPERRSTVETPGHAIRTNNQAPYYLVEIEPVFAPFLNQTGGVGDHEPWEPYHVITESENGLVHVPVPPSQYPSRVTVLPLGVASCQPVEFTSMDFHDRYPESVRQGYYIEHDFQIRGSIPTWPEAHRVFDLEPLDSWKPDGAGSDEKELPGWFTENLPFLLPLVEPILPHIPGDLVLLIPYVVIAIPAIILLIAANAIRSRGKNRADSEDTIE